MESTRHFGTNGFGAAEHDLELFIDMLDAREQQMRVLEGMEAIVLERIANELLSMSVGSLVKTLGIAWSTAQRKIKNEERLAVWESDRVARLLLVFKQAKLFFGEYNRTAQWMKAPLAGLDGRSPLDCLETQPSYDRLMDIVTRMQSGVSA